MRIFGISPFQTNKNTQTRENPSVTTISRGGAFTLSRDIVSFGCRGSNKTDAFSEPLNRNTLSSVPNITCMYCGTEILSDEYIEYIKRSLKTLQGSDLAAVLDNKRKYIKGKKRIVAGRIKYAALKDKKLTFEELIQNLKDEALTALLSKQIKIINKVNQEYAHKFRNPHDRALFANLMSDASSWVYNSGLKDKFKRKKFLEVASSRLSKMKDHRSARDIMDELRRMPTSQADADAFIVKYADRSTDEFIESLFIDAKYSEDHIIPRRAYKDGTALECMPDEDSIANIATVCRHCNNAKKGDKDLGEYIKENKNVPANISKAFDNILASEMEGAEEYVEGLAKTIEKATWLQLKQYHIKAKTPVDLKKPTVHVRSSYNKMGLYKTKKKP